MRTVVLFSLAAAILVAACGDDRPTAPTSSRVANGPPAAGSVMSPASGPSAYGKPPAVVGFTKITLVNGNGVQVQAHEQKLSTAVCPAGSKVIGGSYHMLGYVATASPPWIFAAADTVANAWTVDFDNEQPGAAFVNVHAIAYCAS
jgi:hypothetical protein